MNEEAFVQEREPDWQRLYWLCDKASAGARNLPADEFEEFVRLYRRVSGDLAEARTRSTNESLIAFLNDLVGRCYGVLYQHTRRPLFEAVGAGVLYAAQTVRRRWAFVWASIGLFVVAGVFAYVLMALRPDLRDYMVPPGMEGVVESWKSGQHSEKSSTDALAMTGFYASNNPRAALTAGGLAVSTFGVGTAYVMLTNGALIGTLAYEVQQVGQLGFLVSSILPHGVPELTGIFFSGAAGLLFGWALLRPGRTTRGESLRRVGKDGMALLLTGFLLMFVAAPIEGFFSFNPRVPQSVKMAAGLVALAGMVAFWMLYGRSRDGDPSDSLRPESARSNSDAHRIPRSALPS